MAVVEPVTSRVAEGEVLADKVRCGDKVPVGLHVVDSLWLALRISDGLCDMVIVSVILRGALVVFDGSRLSDCVRPSLSDGETDGVPLSVAERLAELDWDTCIVSDRVIEAVVLSVNVDVTLLLGVFDDDSVLELDIEPVHSWLNVRDCDVDDVRVTVLLRAELWLIERESVSVAFTLHVSDRSIEPLCVPVAVSLGRVTDTMAVTEGVSE